MGAGGRSVNVVSVLFVNLDQAMNKLWYSEEVDFLTKKEEVIVQTTRGRVVTKVGIGMSAAEIMIDSRGILAPHGRKEMGRRIFMFFHMIIKRQKILRVENMRICFILFSTRLKDSIKF